MACAFDCIDERPRTDIFTGVLASTALKGGDTLYRLNISRLLVNNGGSA